MPLRGKSTQSGSGTRERLQWFYHAVADVIRANSLLRSFPEVNADKVGLTGISWGGTIAASAAGADPRWAFVVPVYGCGFIHASDNPGLQQWFTEEAMTAEQLQDYRTKWDPCAHLPHAKMPMMWINGPNDGTFPMDIFQRSAPAAAGPTWLHVRFNWLHGHEPGRKRPEIYAFADSIVKGRRPLPTASRPELDPQTRRVWTKTTGKIRRAALCYTLHDGSWRRRYWENAACEITDGEVSSRLPEGATVFYFNVRDEDLNLVSSVFVELESGKDKR